MMHSEKNPPIPSENHEEKGFLTLRIKPNLPLPSSSNTDPTLTISTDATVYTLKQTISNQLHFQKRYIRLIHSGRLLAPDDAILKSFGMKNDAVVHCVVAKEGVSGGIQAKLANRTSVRNHGRLYNNNNTNHHHHHYQQQPNEVVDRRSGIGSDGRIQPRRRVRRSLLSIGTRNVSTSSIPHDELESDDDSNDEEEEYDEERGQGQFRRERRGFDRLRDQGLTRSEVHAVRIYFSNQVDDYIAATDTTDTTTNDTTDTTTNQEEGDHNHHSRRGQSHSNGNGMTTTDQEHDYDPETALRNRRLRAEEEWMDVQGPYSEFRLNLNADNPFMHRLWMDLGGVGVGGQQQQQQRRTRQRQSRGEGGQEDHDSDQEEEETRFQRPTSTTNTTAGFHMYGPLGTDRDFIWGFVLAYLCGFMMMFWVMNPTVAHRQKLGILTGLCFHILLHMFEHAHDDNDDYSKAVLEQETLLG